MSRRKTIRVRWLVDQVRHPRGFDIWQCQEKLGWAVLDEGLGTTSDIDAIAEHFDVHVDHPRKLGLTKRLVKKVLDRHRLTELAAVEQR